MILLILLGAIPLICYGIAVAKMAGVATSKGYDGWSYGLLCFFTGLLGFLVVLALKDRVQENQLAKMISLLTQQQTSRLGSSADGMADPELPTL